MLLAKIELKISIFSMQAVIYLDIDAIPPPLANRGDGVTNRKCQKHLWNSVFGLRSQKVLRSLKRGPRQVTATN